MEIRLSDQTIFIYPLELLKSLSSVVLDVAKDVSLSTYPIDLTKFTKVSKAHFKHIDRLICGSDTTLEDWAQKTLGYCGYRLSDVPDEGCIELMAVASFLHATFIMAQMEQALCKTLQEVTAKSYIGTFKLEFLEHLYTFLVRYDYKSASGVVKAELSIGRREELKKYVQNRASDEEVDAMRALVQKLRFPANETRGKKKRSIV